MSTIYLYLFAVCYTHFVKVCVPVHTPIHRLLEPRRGHWVSCPLTPQLIPCAQGLSEPGAFPVRARLVDHQWALVSTHNCRVRGARITSSFTQVPRIWIRTSRLCSKRSHPLSRWLSYIDLNFHLLVMKRPLYMWTHSNCNRMHKTYKIKPTKSQHGWRSVSQSLILA